MFSYAQTLMIVNLILVKLVGVLVITRYHTGVKSPYYDTTFLSSSRPPDTYQDPQFKR